MKTFMENFVKAIAVFPVIVLLLPVVSGAADRIVVGELVTNTA